MRVVEPLLQEERLAQPCPRGLERVAHVASGGGAELRLGERRLAVGLAHGGVGLHDEALGPHLERPSVVEGGPFAPGAEPPEPEHAPTRATAAAPKTTREGNHQSPSGMGGV